MKINRLEKTLGTIFVAGLVTFGVGLSNGNRAAKNIGATIAGLSAISLCGYEIEKYEKEKKNS